MIFRILKHRFLLSVFFIFFVDRENVFVRLNIDSGGRKPLLTKLSMSLIIPELGDMASNDSHKNSFVLASTSSYEQFSVVEALWCAANVEEIIKKYEIRLTCENG